jgi:DNA repair photolyase
MSLISCSPFVLYKTGLMPYVVGMADEIPNQAKAGRGAVGNPAGRFERYASRAVDDGWAQNARPSIGLTDEDPDEEKIQTTLHIDTSRSVINYIESEDLAGMRSINPYRGCEHGCIYCFARPSHSYLGYSAGLDFETQIFYKPEAPEILRHELAAKNYKPDVITLGSNTDCYQPAERGLKLTRRILEVFHECNHPVSIVTKAALVTRDIDLLAPMAKKRLASVAVSFTTLDPLLSRVMEPRAAAPWKRLATMKALAQAGIPVTVMTAPLIPGLNDMEMEKLLQAAWGSGARAAHFTVVRLPYELKDLFREWLKTHRPDRAEHVLSLIRQTRGGKLYDADYSQRRRGRGPYADLIAHRFALACRRIGFNRQDWDYDLSLFRKPETGGQMGFAFG